MVAAGTTVACCSTFWQGALRGASLNYQDLDAIAVHVGGGPEWRISQDQVTLIDLGQGLAEIHDLGPRRGRVRDHEIDTTVTHRFDDIDEPGELDHLEGNAEPCRQRLADADRDALGFARFRIAHHGDRAARVDADAQRATWSERLPLDG